MIGSVGGFVGYVYCFTGGQDLTACHGRFAAFGVTPDRVHVDHGLTGAVRGLAWVRRAAVRADDTLSSRHGTGSLARFMPRALEPSSPGPPGRRPRAAVSGGGQAAGAGW